MTTREVADKLIGLCRTGQFEQAQNELYADNVVSIEPEGVPNNRTEGIAGVKAKGEKWAQSVEEVHSAELSEPLIAGNQFAITHTIDCTFKGQGRMKFSEISVYEVKDGKVVKEQFFHDMP